MNPLASLGRLVGRGAPALFAGAMLLAGPSRVPAQVVITPHRVVLEGRSRAAALTLVNPSARPVTYRLGFVDLVQRQDGGYTKVTHPGPGDRFAGDLIVLAPRVVTIAPGARQVVRLMRRGGGSLEPGEYISHLRVAPEAPGLSLPGPADSGSVVVRVALEVTLPVIVRHQLPAGVATSIDVSDLALEPSTDGSASLLLTLRRAGPRSTLGGVSVTLVTPAGDEYPVADVHGVSLLTPLESRRLRLALRAPAGISLHEGSLIAVYRSADGEPPMRAEAGLEIT